MAKKKDEFTLLEDIVEGFADVVDGSIFDFDDEPVREATNGDDSGADGNGASEIPSGEGKSRGSNGGRKPTPGKLEGVSIATATTGKEKTGKAAGNKEPSKSGDGDGSGTGNTVSDPAIKSD